MDDYLLTVREVAEELRVSDMTIHRLVDRGELPAIYVGTLKRISRSALDEFRASSVTRRRSA